MYTKKEQHQCDDNFVYFNIKKQAIEYKPNEENLIIPYTIWKIKQMSYKKLKELINDLTLKTFIK